MRSILAFFALILLSSAVLAAPQGHTDAPGIRMYHSLFNSKLLDKKAATSLDLVRANDVATLTIALTKPLDKGQFSLGKPGLLKAHTLNVRGQRKDLEFTAVNEGEITYYIAQVRHSKDEVLRFFIIAGFDDGARVSTKFNQRMYLGDD